jgi:hypothetical protein
MRASSAPIAAQSAASGARWCAPGRRSTIAAGLPFQGEDERAVRVAVRSRHRQAALGVVLHQREVERQLGGGEALEQRQHVAAVRGVGEVVGVLDAAGARREREQLADADARRQRRRFLEFDFGVRPPSARQKRRTLQTRLPAEPREVPGSSAVGW